MAIAVFISGSLLGTGDVNIKEEKKMRIVLGLFIASSLILTSYGCVWQHGEGGYQRHEENREHKEYREHKEQRNGGYEGDYHDSRHRDENGDYEDQH